MKQRTALQFLKRPGSRIWLIPGKLVLFFPPWPKCFKFHPGVQNEVKIIFIRDVLLIYYSPTAQYIRIMQSKLLETLLRMDCCNSRSVLNRGFHVSVWFWPNQRLRPPRNPDLGSSHGRLSSTLSYLTGVSSWRDNTIQHAHTSQHTQGQRS